MSKIAPTAGKRLLELRNAKGLSRNQLAAKVRAHHNQIQKLENGERKLTIEWIEKLAPALGVEPEDFLRATTAGAIASVEMIHGTEFARLPLYDIRASAGRGALVQDGEPIGWRLFDFSWVREISHSALEFLKVIQVASDSMEPTLFNGDHVLVDLARRSLAQDGLFVLRIEDGLMVKRIQRKYATGAVRIISDNPRYEPEEIIEPDRLLVVGRVIWLGRQCG